MSIFNHEFDAETTPLYFSLALTRSYNIYIVYFLLFIVCITCFGYPVNALPVAGWLATCLLARHYMNRIFIRWNFLFYVIIPTTFVQPHSKRTPCSVRMRSGRSLNLYFYASARFWLVIFIVAINAAARNSSPITDSIARESRPNNMPSA